MKRRHWSWMISPKSFITALGAEYELMRHAGGRVLLKFYVASISIFIIAVSSFLSIRYAMHLLFSITLVEILLSFFLTSLFVLIYIFLINTFTKKQIWEDEEELTGIKREQMELLSFSNLSRIIFVIFMGFSISKPIEIFVYKLQLDKRVELYKTELLAGYAKRMNELYQKDIEQLNNYKSRREDLNTDRGPDNEIRFIDEQIIAIENVKEDYLTVARYKIDESHFFSYRIRTCSYYYPLSWVICTVITLFFMFPGFLVYSISRDDEYYKMKTKRDKHMITTGYSAFVEKYKLLFQRKYGYPVEPRSVYQDPPFNTKRKPGAKYDPAEEFFKKYSAD